MGAPIQGSESSAAKFQEMIRMTSQTDPVLRPTRSRSSSAHESASSPDPRILDISTDPFRNIRTSTPMGTKRTSQEASLSSEVRVQRMGGTGSKRKATGVNCGDPVTGVG